MARISDYVKFISSKRAKFYNFDYETIKEFRKFYTKLYDEKGPGPAFRFIKEINKSGKVKISDIIKYLEMLKEEEGDLEVRYLKKSEGKEYFSPVTEFDVINGNIIDVSTSSTKGTTTLDIGKAQ